MYKSTAAFLCFLCLSFFGHAQKRVHLKVEYPKGNEALVESYKLKSTFDDSLKAVREIVRLVHTLQNDSYLTASVDSIYLKNDTVFATLFIGESYEWAKLKPGLLSETVLENSGFRERFFRGKPFRPIEFVKLQENILDFAENHGFPFASVYLDSINIVSNQIAANLNFDSGPFIVFDSILIFGSTTIKNRFLAKYLQINAGEPYEHKRVLTSERLIRQLPYIKLSRSPQVRFSKEKAQVVYYLEEIKSNQIDGLVGFLPNNGPGNRFLITGQANLDIRNIKGGGKEIGLNWRRFDFSSQLMNATFTYPNFLGSPFEFGLNFHLLKQDSSFITINPKVRLSYNTQKYGKFTFYNNIRNSRVLATSHLKNLTSLPNFLDVKFNSYGIEYQWNNLDNYYFPKKGVLGALNFSLGNKVISKNLNIEPARLYDSINLRTNQLALGLNLEKYSRLGKNAVLVNRLNGEGLINKNLFLNDLYRVGGLRSLRGFDDFFFFASRYLVGTLEYRLFTSEDSYVMLFFDQAYVRKEINKLQVDEYPSGFGAGVSFSTGAGVFQLVYSLGRSREQQIGFSQSKIHFGLVNRF